MAASAATPVRFVVCLAGARVVAALVVRGFSLAFAARAAARLAAVLAVLLGETGRAIFDLYGEAGLNGDCGSVRELRERGESTCDARTWRVCLEFFAGFRSSPWS